MSGATYNFRHYWDGTGGRGDLDDYDDGRPSASDLAEEQWEEDRRRNYPRGYGPAWGDEVEDDPAYIDPDLASLESVDPDRFLPEKVVREAKRAITAAEASLPLKWIRRGNLPRDHDMWEKDSDDLLAETGDPRRYYMVSYENAGLPGKYHWAPYVGLRNKRMREGGYLTYLGGKPEMQDAISVCQAHHEGS